MDKQYLVSVIIPAYNAGKYIADTLKSVQQQTWAHLEVIVVNDGSTDNTEEVVKGFLQDPRFIYHYQENKGCSGAKNAGLQLARGDFINFLDADDKLSAGKIEEQVSAIKNDPWKMAVCRTKSFQHQPEEPGGEEIDTAFLYSSDNMLEFVLNLYGLNSDTGMIQPNAFLISRQLAHKAGQYDLSVSPSPDEDGEYFCRVMLAAGGIVFTPGCINYYRRTVSTQHHLSRQKSHLHARGALRSLDLKAAHLLATENSTRVKTLMARHYAEFIYQYHAWYSDLVQEAEEKIRELGINRIPAAGGANFKRFAKIIGFKRALRLKQWVR